MGHISERQPRLGRAGPCPSHLPAPKNVYVADNYQENKLDIEHKALGLKEALHPEKYKRVQWIRTRVPLSYAGTNFLIEPPTIPKGSEG